MSEQLHLEGLLDFIQKETEKFEEKLKTEQMTVRKAFLTGKIIGLMLVKEYIEENLKKGVN
ncbi:MAG: hypothetical protein N2043_01805 [Ignavibacterium sp.]|nr:hypothetical protein [Ignavibacterium sp.]